MSIIYIEVLGSALWAWSIVLLYPIAWWCLNHRYAQIYGSRLKTRWAWASPGALLFRVRMPRWERTWDMRT